MAQQRFGCYVGNIDKSITVEMLRNVFAQCGTILDASLNGRDTDPYRYGFIDFASEGERQRAMQLNEYSLAGRKLKVGPSKGTVGNPSTASHDRVGAYPPQLPPTHFSPFPAMRGALPNGAFPQPDFTNGSLMGGGGGVGAVALAPGNNPALPPAAAPNPTADQAMWVFQALQATGAPHKEQPLMTKQLASQLAVQAVVQHYGIGGPYAQGFHPRELPANQRPSPEVIQLRAAQKHQYMEAVRQSGLRYERRVQKIVARGGRATSSSSSASSSASSSVGDETKETSKKRSREDDTALGSEEATASDDKGEDEMGGNKQEEGEGSSSDTEPNGSSDAEE